MASKLLDGVKLDRWHWTGILDLEANAANTVEVEYVSGGSNNCITADIVLQFLPSGRQELGSVRVGEPVGNRAVWRVFSER